jgi:hypothetical protein
MKPTDVIVFVARAIAAVAGVSVVGITLSLSLLGRCKASKQLR